LSSYYKKEETLDNSTESQLSSQVELSSLESSLLETEIGTSDPSTIVFMIKNMEEQLIDLYKKKEGYLSVMASQLHIRANSKVFFRESQLKDQGGNNE
jgi:hypothetical protein